MVTLNMSLNNQAEHCEGEWVKLEMVRFWKQNYFYEGVIVPATKIKTIASNVDRDIVAARERYVRFLDRNRKSV